MAAVELMVIDVETLASANAIEQLRACRPGRRSRRRRGPLRRRQRMVGIHAHLGGQVERDGKAGGALREQVLVTAVAFFGGAETGVLAHGPEAGAVHFRVDAARVGEFAGLVPWRTSGAGNFSGAQERRDAVSRRAG